MCTSKPKTTLDLQQGLRTTILVLGLLASHLQGQFSTACNAPVYSSQSACPASECHVITPCGDPTQQEYSSAPECKNDKGEPLMSHCQAIEHFEGAFPNCTCTGPESERCIECERTDRPAAGRILHSDRGACVLRTGFQDGNTIFWCEADCTCTGEGAAVLQCFTTECRNARNCN